MPYCPSLRFYRTPSPIAAEDLKLNRFITNLHTNNDELSHGVYHGANRSSGRWPNTHALDLYRKDSHLSLDLHEDHKELSVAFGSTPTGISCTLPTH